MRHDAFDLLVQKPEYHYNDVIIAWWRLKLPALRLFTQPFIQAQIKETSKLHVTGLCAGNSPVTGEFPAQMASKVENVSIWWHHHDSRTAMWTPLLYPRPTKLEGGYTGCLWPGLLHRHVINSHGIDYTSYPCLPWGKISTIYTSILRNVLKCKYISCLCKEVQLLRKYPNLRFDLLQRVSSLFLLGIDYSLRVPNPLVRLGAVWLKANPLSIWDPILGTDQNVIY